MQASLLVPHLCSTLVLTWFSHWDMLYCRFPDERPWYLCNLNLLKVQTVAFETYICTFFLNFLKLIINFCKTFWKHNVGKRFLKTCIPFLYIFKCFLNVILHLFWSWLQSLTCRQTLSLDVMYNWTALQGGSVCSLTARREIWGLLLKAQVTFASCVGGISRIYTPVLERIHLCIFLGIGLMHVWVFIKMLK